MGRVRKREREQVQIWRWNCLVLQGTSLEEQFHYCYLITLIIKAIFFSWFSASPDEHTRIVIVENTGL